MYNPYKILCAASAALALSACSHFDEKSGAAGSGEPGIIAAEVGVTVSADGKGGFTFRYSGDYIDEEGNLDLASGAAAENSVRIEISIAGGPEGLRFKTEGRDAMWIADAEAVGRNASPRGPYEGEQFTEFSVDSDGQRLSVLDRNFDGRLYRYGLRFDFEGATVMDDPDVQNGTGGHR
ncbi:MAG: hypothetical protein WD076_10260 [Parvularculaceae bacterium]